jgi:hypothetical protein
VSDAKEIHVSGNNADQHTELSGGEVVVGLLPGQKSTRTYFTKAFTKLYYPHKITTKKIEDGKWLHHANPTNPRFQVTGH